MVANILHHRGDVGWADAEGAVPHLPSEGRPMPSLGDPQGRVRFDQPQRFRHRERRGKRHETVNMVGPGVRVHQLTVDIAADPAQISEQVRGRWGGRSDWRSLVEKMTGVSRLAKV